MLKNKILNLSLPLFKYLIPLRLPRIIALEATNRCFLNCITCPIPNQMKREKGDMSLATFILLLKQIDWKISKLSWVFGGEPLLNKDLWQMVRLAAEKGMPSKVDTNGMLIYQHIDDIFVSNLRVLNIAFEGFSKKSTGLFRQGYNYELVINNIKLLSAEKNKRKAKYPLIALNFLVKRDNEDEIERAIEFARKLKLNSITLKSINIASGSWLSQEQEQNLAEQFLPQKKTEFSRYQKIKNKWEPKEEFTYFCRYLLNSVTISWDGKVLPCCQDFDASMAIGDIQTENLKSIWTSKKFKFIRKKVYAGQIQTCNNCTSMVLQKSIILSP